MRLKSATFRNLKPIYRSSGKREITIDFTKCQHKIVLILGKNGSGKTTIMNALQPLPESPSLYLDGEEGEKVIEYFFEDLVYRLRIVYPVNGMRQRTVTKAYLTKIMPDKTEIDLNPNGNIGSYKDSLYAEFKLDPNFVSLTQLSMEDKGIVERIPSDRKRFVNSILEEVQEYNDIYKTLNKRSSIFKSMVNNINAKIDMIGDKDLLSHQLESLNSNIEMLENTIDHANADISRNTATIQMIDPDGKIQERYAILHSNLSRIIDRSKEIDLLLGKYKTKFSNKESVIEEIEKTNEIIRALNLELITTKDRLSEYLVSREEDYKSFQMKKQKLDAMKSDFVVDDLKKTIKTLKENIYNYESIFQQIGIDGLSITKDEYVIGLNTLNDIKDMVTNMRSYVEESSIRSAINAYRTDYDLLSEKNTLNEEIKRIEKEIEDDKQKISYFNGLEKTASILEKRPESCSDDNCPFIYNALEAYKQEPRKNIDVLNEKIDKNSNQLNSLKNQLCKLELTIQSYQMLINIIRTVNNNSSIILKLPVSDSFLNIENFLVDLENGSNFNEINKLYSYIQYANLLEQYKNEKEELTKMEYDYKLYENKISMIEEIDSELSNLQIKLDRITETITKYQNDIEVSSKKLLDLESHLQTLNRLKELYETKDNYKTEQSEIENEINLIIGNMKKIEENIILSNQANQVLIKAKSDIKPLQENREKIKFNLERLDEYYKELEEYNQKYSMVELIKKYSSPTKGGIQTLFTKLYMGKTLQLTNELLSYLFNGELELLPYIINESEFRIPCKNINSSVINDDISSCSSAEKSMISMILSFALLKQSSTKYNILKMDEMDGMLDQTNKTNFVTVLEIIMDKLDVENCLLVSHSSEIDMSKTDIILLSEDNNYGYNENVIFSF